MIKKLNLNLKKRIHRNQFKRSLSRLKNKKSKKKKSKNKERQLRVEAIGQNKMKQSSKNGLISYSQ